MKEYLGKYSHFIKLFICLTLFFFGSLLKLIPIVILNLDLETISDTTNNYLTYFSKALVFIILILMYRKEFINYYKDFKNKTLSFLKEGFNIWFIGLMVMVFSNLIISLINNNVNSTNEEAVLSTLLANPILGIFMVSIAAPVIEEIVFRQSFKDVFKNKWTFILTSGLLFGSLHVLLTPMNSNLDYLFLIPYCSLGIAFSYMFYKTNNLLVPITFHSLHNFLNAVLSIISLGVILW